MYKLMAMVVRAYTYDFRRFMSVAYTTLNKLLAVFTAQCYYYATVSRLSVRPSDCLSVMLRYDFHTDWNTSKTISWPNTLRLQLWLTPTWAIWCNGNTPKIRVGSLRSTKNVQYLRNGAR